MGRSDSFDLVSMECLSCGVDIGGNIGLCGECREARAASRTPKAQQRGGNGIKRNPSELGAGPQKLSTLSELVSLVSSYPTIAALLLLAPLGLFLLAGEILDESVTFSSSSPEAFELSSPDGSSRIGYVRGSAVTETIRVLDYDVNRLAFSYGAIGAHLAYLTESEYREFRAIRGCVAGFLNSHAKHLLIIPGSNAAREQQRAVRLRRGDAVRVRVRELAPVQVQMSGHRLSPRDWFPGHRIVELADVERLPGA